jgi:hypothetical protein
VLKEQGGARSSWAWAGTFRLPLTPNNRDPLKHEALRHLSLASLLKNLPYTDRAALKLFAARRRIYFKDAAMKALLTSRPEVRWMALALPALFIAHWLVTGLWIELLRFVPDSVRAVLHLI